MWIFLKVGRHQNFEISTIKYDVKFFIREPTYRHEEASSPGHILVRAIWTEQDKVTRPVDPPGFITYYKAVIQAGRRVILEEIHIILIFGGLATAISQIGWKLVTCEGCMWGRWD